MLKGAASAVDQARRVLESLYGMLEEGQSIDIANVDTMIRMVADRGQPADAARPSRRRARCAWRRSRRARPPSSPARRRRTPICAPWIAPSWSSASARPVPARPISRSRMPRRCSSAATSTASSCRRPAVEAGERLGFLPGDMKEKVDPYLRPLYDALYDMMRPEHVERCITSGIIEVAPLAFMRGRTLANAVVILDEAQNTTSMQMKMFLTRLGENSKMIVTGDPIADRSAARREIRSGRGGSACSTASRASTSRASTTRTWCATRWSAGSSGLRRRDAKSACRQRMSEPCFRSKVGGQHAAPRSASKSRATPKAGPRPRCPRRTGRCARR